MSEETVDLVALMNMRARTYGLLANLFREEVDADSLRELQAMRFPTATGNAKVDEGYHLLYDYLKTAWDDSVTELAIDFVRTFIGHGVNAYSAAYPYESVYTSERRLMMQERAPKCCRAARERFEAWRMERGRGHVALEFEFMQRMSLRAAEALAAGDEDEAVGQLRTQRTFLHDHLLNWLPLLTNDMRLFSRTLFYQGLAQLAMGFAEEDASILAELLDSVEVAA